MCTEKSVIYSLQAIILTFLLCVALRVTHIRWYLAQLLVGPSPLITSEDALPLGVEWFPAVSYRQGPHDHDGSLNAEIEGTGTVAPPPLPALQEEVSGPNPSAGGGPIINMNLPLAQLLLSRLQAINPDGFQGVKGRGGVPSPQPIPAPSPHDGHDRMDETASIVGSEASRGGRAVIMASERTGLILSSGGGSGRGTDGMGSQATGQISSSQMAGISRKDPALVGMAEWLRLVDVAISHDIRVRFVSHG